MMTAKHESHDGYTNVRRRSWTKTHDAEAGVRVLLLDGETRDFGQRDTQIKRRGEMVVGDEDQTDADVWRDAEVQIDKEAENEDECCGCVQTSE